ncbi:fluoride efflux transporter CrcB [Antrihabitans cavernicola]|uniref:Fluoride-specific ion channel FluC n=1 Tax=Antrihabitans cavernicola TaxID=2495913 RepID=A0A5A7SFK7_9NOCA|nr:fluoride efflux transporter CrcB [Spelaeibacter cavernicola]
MISVGGGIGALARYGIGHMFPVAAGHVPWSTLAINAIGCFLIGVLMVLITEVWSAHRLLRPFLGVGILGGFTTFSTYTNEIRALFAAGDAVVAMVYLAGTLLAALLAVIAGVALARAVTGTVIEKGAVDA